MPLLNIVFVSGLNFSEIHLHINEKCAVFDILCSFVTAQRIHYLEYELPYFLAYKTHRPIRHADFFVRNFRKNNKHILI
jgi:hypothetical protein